MPGDRADTLLRHLRRLSSSQTMADIADAELVRRLVDEATRQKNRLTSCLKIYFPQLLRWFDDIGSPVAGASGRWNTSPGGYTVTALTVGRWLRWR